MGQPQPVIRCPYCQQENDPAASACRACRQSLLVSLAVTRPAPPDIARSLAALLSGGNEDQVERLETRLLRGRGVLMREIRLADAVWCQEQAAQSGVTLEVRRWAVLSSPVREVRKVPWHARPLTGALIVAMLAVAVLFIHHIYRIIVTPPGDAGIRWQTSTVVPGRIVPASLPLATTARPEAPVRLGMPSQSMLDTAAKAVVRISLKDNIGTGFFIDRRGYIVTNHHVISDGGAITVTTATRQRAQATVVRSAPSWDLALLKVDLEPPAVLEPADGALTPLGTHATIIGSAEGLDGSQRQGEVTGVKRVMDGVSLLELALPAARGNSGSPVLDDSGRVIGVINAILTESNRTSYAVVSNYLFDGPDALMRDIQRVWPLSSHFLDLELQALADVGERVLLDRTRAMSQAFVTSDGILAAVVRVRSDDVRLNEPQVEVNFWLRRDAGEEVVSQFIQASTSYPPDGESDMSRAVYFRYQLTPEDHQALLKADEAWLEVQSKAPRLQAFIELKRVDNLTLVEPP